MTSHPTEASELTKQMLKKMFAENIRFDGRKLDEFRDIEISFDVSNQAEGSARVKIGKTDVIAGVKLEVGEPYPDSPDKGNLMVAGELLPIASPDFESGPPKFNDIEIPRLVDRTIRASEIIDLSKLVIEAGEKVWTVIIDVYPLNDDGNLIDALSIAAMAALSKAVMPELDKDGKIDHKKKSKTLVPINRDIIPLSISFSKLGNHLILDPTREEEQACEARITWGISKTKDGYRLNGVQKRGETPLSTEEVNQMMDTITKQYDNLGEKLKKAL